MSILPEKNPSSTTQLNAEPARAEEWAWDFDAREFKTKAGKMFKVYDDEAIKIWLWKLFLTERFEWLVHTERYGAEHHTLIGQGYSAPYINALAEQMTREAIEKNLSQYIKEIRPVDTETPMVFFYGGTLYITFYADTIYNREVKFDIVYNTYNR